VGPGQKLPWAPHTSTPRELKQRLEAERTGLPHLIHRDESGAQVVTVLNRDAVTVGRGERAAVCLSWDAGVSRVHAEITRIDDVWTLVDDGLSRNGSFVNDERVAGRRRLEDADVMRFGSTMVVFRAPIDRFKPTEPARPLARPTTVSPSERLLLVALCRPLLGVDHPFPATNNEIAAELCLSIPAVKRRLGILFERFDLEALPHNAKRARLADVAISTGLVSPLDA